jgi:hypothetical protein
VKRYDSKTLGLIQDIVAPLKVEKIAFTSSYSLADGNIPLQINLTNR